MESWGAFLAVGGVFAFTILLILFVFGAVILMWRLLGSVGGWNRLAERYPAVRPPQGEVRSGQTVKVGAVRYRFMIRVSAEPEGLYLATGALAPFLKNPPLMVPWSAFSRVQKTLLYWGQARELSVGQPPLTSITVWKGLFDTLRPYLAPSITQDM